MFRTYSHNKPIYIFSHLYAQKKIIIENEIVYNNGKSMFDKRVTVDINKWSLKIKLIKSSMSLELIINLSWKDETYKENTDIPISCHIKKGCNIIKIPRSFHYFPSQKNTKAFSSKSSFSQVASLIKSFISLL